MSTPVATLADGALKAMFFTNCKIALLVVIAGGIFGLGAGIGAQSVLNQRRNNSDARVASADHSPPVHRRAVQAASPTASRASVDGPQMRDKETKIQTTISGRVLDDAGKPIAGANVEGVAIILPALRGPYGSPAPRMAGSSV